MTAGGEEAKPGLVIEAQARRIAAITGLPDFVYGVPIIHKGGATREVGDGLLYANGHGAVVQVKSREPGASSTKAANWIEKHGRKAYRQARGTLRSIRDRQLTGRPLRAIPTRVADLDKSIQVACALLLNENVADWSPIVILDHPSAHGLNPPDLPAFFVTLDDWSELNRAIRSTTGLLMYINRVLNDPAVPTPTLGNERDRYALILQADQDYVRANGPGTRAWFSRDALDDPVGAQHYRGILERVWPNDAPLPEVPIEEYRVIVEYLDGIMPGVQVEIGNRIHLKHQLVRKHRRWQSFTFRSSTTGTLIAFACDYLHNYPSAEQFDSVLAAFAATRAREAAERCDPYAAILALGHLFEDTGELECRYIFQSPPFDIPDDEMRSILWVCGRIDGSDLAIGRYDPCPCDSGKKYKFCCERSS